MSSSKSNARLKIPKRLIMFSITETSEIGVLRVHVHPQILSDKEAKPVPSKDLVLICAPPSDLPPPLNYYTTIKCIRTVTLLPL